MKFVNLFYRNIHLWDSIMIRLKKKCRKWQEKKKLLNLQFWGQSEKLLNSKEVKVNRHLIINLDLITPKAHQILAIKSNTKCLKLEARLLIYYQKGLKPNKLNLNTNHLSNMLKIKKNLYSWEIQTEVNLSM